MTDADILDALHAAIEAHAGATGIGYGQALFPKLAAEQAAIDRFGLGPHRRLTKPAFPRRRDDEYD